MSADQAFIEATDLARWFDVSPPLLDRLVERQGRRWVKAVDGVDFAIKRGETFALVGESGCGKSTVARLMVGLYRPSRGHIRIDGVDPVTAKGEAARKLRRRLQMIFQDPFTSLNPRWRVKHIIAEPLRAHGLAITRAELTSRVNALLAQVKLAPEDGEKYPHEFSGGQRQRISIARALAASPEFLVCDEPTSALDVSIQAQILNLMKSLQRELGLTYLLISHNLAVVYQMSDHVGVMYLGRLVEVAAAPDLFAGPQHPYTRLLLETVPDLSRSGPPREPVAGEVPSPLNPPSGCAFHPRCAFANARCAAEIPALRATSKHRVACHAVEEGRLPAWRAGG